MMPEEMIAALASLLTEYQNSTKEPPAATTQTPDPVPAGSIPFVPQPVAAGTQASTPQLIAPQASTPEAESPVTTVTGESNTTSEVTIVTDNNTIPPSDIETLMQQLNDPKADSPLLQELRKQMSKDMLKTPQLIDPVYEGENYVNSENSLTSRTLRGFGYDPATLKKLEE